jgi:hypothetical protein
MVAFGFHIQEPLWSGWESYIPRGIQYVSYRIAFGFQTPELEWPGAIPPIGWPTDAPLHYGIQYCPYVLAFVFHIQEPDWPGWESYIPRGIQYLSYRVAFGCLSGQDRFPR